MEEAEKEEIIESPSNKKILTKEIIVPTIYLNSERKPISSLFFVCLGHMTLSE